MLTKPRIGHCEIPTSKSPPTYQRCTRLHSAHLSASPRQRGVREVSSARPRCSHCGSRDCTLEGSTGTRQAPAHAAGDLRWPVAFNACAGHAASHLPRSGHPRSSWDPLLVDRLPVLSGTPGIFAKKATGPPTRSSPRQLPGRRSYGRCNAPKEDFSWRECGASLLALPFAWGNPADTNCWTLRDRASTGQPATRCSGSRTTSARTADARLRTGSTPHPSVGGGYHCPKTISRIRF